MRKTNALAVARPRPRLGFHGFAIGGSIFWMTCLALISASGCGSTRGGSSMTGGYIGRVPTIPGKPGPAVVALPLAKAYVFRGPVQFAGRKWGTDQYMDQHEPILPGSIMLLSAPEYAAIVPPYVAGFGFEAKDVTVVFEEGSMGQLPPNNRAGLYGLDVRVAGKVRKGYGVRLVPYGHERTGGVHGCYGINNATFHFEVAYRGAGGVTETRHWGPFAVSGQ